MNRNWSRQDAEAAVTTIELRLPAHHDDLGPSISRRSGVPERKRPDFGNTLLQLTGCREKMIGEATQLQRFGRDDHLAQLQRLDGA